MWSMMNFENVSRVCMFVRYIPRFVGNVAEPSHTWGMQKRRSRQVSTHAPTAWSRNVQGAGRDTIQPGTSSLWMHRFPRATHTTRPILKHSHAIESKDIVVRMPVKGATRAPWSLVLPWSSSCLVSTQHLRCRTVTDRWQSFAFLCPQKQNECFKNYVATSGQISDWVKWKIFITVKEKITQMNTTLVKVLNILLMSKFM